MAFSSTQVKHDLMGNTQVKFFSVDFAAVTSGHVKTGFSNVLAAFFNNAVSEAQGLVKINRDSGDTAAEAGGVHISGVTLSDTGVLVVFGN